MDILTGVYSGNSLSGDFLDEIICNGVDLTYEEWRKENPDADGDDYYADGDRYILGFILDEKSGLYDIDENAPISVIYNSNENTVQIVRSQWVFTDARMCSPCYPNQADMDSIGGGVCGYAVNPEDVSEYDENAVKIAGMVKPIAEIKETT